MCIHSLRQRTLHAMCASNPESWRWMRKVIDFSFERFPVDGGEPLIADQGRCNCEKCSRWCDMEYHARLNIQVCDYVRSRWKNKSARNQRLGNEVRGSPEPSLHGEDEREGGLHNRRTGHTATAGRVLIEEGYRSSSMRLWDHRRALAGSPPQHLRRDRWFLPTVQRQGEHLAGLLSDGGRACEYLFEYSVESRRRAVVLGDRQSSGRASNVLAETPARVGGGAVQNA